jgi:hypothetical protein
MKLMSNPCGGLFVGSRDLASDGRFRDARSRRERFSNTAGGQDAKQGAGEDG